MTQPTSAEVVCAACSTPGSGQFCSSCGASLETSRCGGCDAELSAGARFCHGCGRPSGNAWSQTPGPGTVSAAVPAPTTRAASLPWIVTAIALVTVLAFFAGNAFNKPRGSALDAPQNALPQAGLDDRGMTDAGNPSEDAVRGPDISQLSPQERADITAAVTDARRFTGVAR